VTDLLDPGVAYFVEVATHGSFSAAASALRVSQPSVSVAVKKLEERLDTQLFHRHARGVKLTPAGERLLSRAREAAGALSAARDEIDSLQTEPRGSFVLGCHESLGTYVLPGFMGRFLERYPDIELSLHNANSKDIEYAIVERTVDLGLVVNPARHPDCVVRELFDDRVTFVVAEALTKQRKEPLMLLTERPLFFVPALRQTQVLLAELESRDIPVGRTVACSSMELVKSLVLDGAGVGVLPYRVAAHGVAEGRLRPLSRKLPGFDDHITLVWRADAPMTAGLRIVLDALLDHGKRMPRLPRGVA
jgi:DNA-binding transcriptional LysR family regulator